MVPSVVQCSVVDAPPLRLQEAEKAAAQRKAAYAQHLVLVGKFIRARAVVERAIDLDPGLPSAWLALSRIEAAEGKSHLAGKNLDRAIALGADHPGYALLTLQTLTFRVWSDEPAPEEKAADPEKP